MTQPDITAQRAELEESRGRSARPSTARCSSRHKTPTTAWPSSASSSPAGPSRSSRPMAA